jgi:hypothetical protein
VKDTFMTGLALLALALIPQQGALAVERLSAAELDSHCKHVKADPGGIDGIFCIRYIQGFIDGAIVTDERVTLNVANEYDGDESFSERAIRIRLGQRLARYTSYYAEFCLGDPVPLAEVVSRVATHLENKETIPDSQLARAVVYAALREHYPCEPDN